MPKEKRKENRTGHSVRASLPPSSFRPNVLTSFSFFYIPFNFGMSFPVHIPSFALGQQRVRPPVGGRPAHTCLRPASADELGWVPSCGTPKTSRTLLRLLPCKRSCPRSSRGLRFSDARHPDAAGKLPLSDFPGEYLSY